MLANDLTRGYFERNIDDTFHSRHVKKSNVTTDLLALRTSTTYYLTEQPSNLCLALYAVNPGYPRDLKSSTASATTSFRGVTCVNPSSSSALVVLKLMLNRTSFVKLGSPRGAFGIRSSTAILTDFVQHIHQVQIRKVEADRETYEGLDKRRDLS